MPGCLEDYSQRREGRGEGVAEGRRRDRDEGVELGFGAPDPRDREATVAGQAEKEILWRWLRTAHKVETLDAVRAALAG